MHIRGREGEKMKVPVFFAKIGHFGERGWCKISFWTYLKLVQEHVTKVRWMKLKCKKEEK